MIAGDGPATPYDGPLDVPVTTGRFDDYVVYARDPDGVLPAEMLTLEYKGDAAKG